MPFGPIGMVAGGLVGAILGGTLGLRRTGRRGGASEAEQTDAATPTTDDSGLDPDTERPWW